MRKNGKPIANGEFISWTDVTTSRSESIVENLFGESIQLHQDYLLGDVLRTRPMMVHYRYAFNYIIEGIIALLFVLGIWAGRRSRFFWLAMSYFALDMVLHVGLGFGINEVYIMSAHWIYIIPIAVAFLLEGYREAPQGSRAERTDSRAGSVSVDMERVAHRAVSLLLTTYRRNITCKYFAKKNAP